MRVVWEGGRGAGFLHGSYVTFQRIYITDMDSDVRSLIRDRHSYGYRSCVFADSPWSKRVSFRVKSFLILFLLSSTCTHRMAESMKNPI